MRAASRLGLGPLAVLLTLLFAFGGSAAQAQTVPGCPDDTNLNRDYNCPYGPTYLVPGLTDVNGFKDRSHYRNIFAADLTGDKVDELVVRGIGGIQVYRWDATRGQWTQVVVNSILSDDEGWARRRYYDTIRLGDIDGDGKAEIVARASTGIVVYKYKATDQDNGGFTQIGPSTGPMADKDKNGGDRCFSHPPPPTEPDRGGCWGGDPSYYSTIQLAPLGDQTGNAGDQPTMQLIGRGGDGLEFWKWNGNGWTQNETLNVGGAFTDAGGWTDQQYYENILPWDKDTLVARASNGLQVYEYKNGSWSQATASGPFPNPKGGLDPSIYTTLQLFHGAQDSTNPVVLGRDTDGVHLFQYEPTTARWHSIVGGDLPLSNGAGYTVPKYYRTIQAADANGDGVDELIARANNTMLTISYSESTHTWSKNAIGGPNLADDPWALDPSYYRTIKTVRLDPSKKAARSLIARGPYGVRTWWFDPSGKRWTRFKRYGGYPSFTGTQATAYKYVNEFLLGDSGAEIRNVYAARNSDPKAPLQTYLGKDGLSGLCSGADNSVPPPHYTTCNPTPAAVKAGVSTADWTAVSNQIIAELFWAIQITAHFNSVAHVQSLLFQDEGSEFPSVSDTLKLVQADNAAADVNYLNLFEGIVDILSEITAEIPGVGEAFGVTGGALGIADAATAGVQKPNDLQRKITEVETAIGGIQTEAQDATMEHRNYVLGDYGLMSTVGQLIGGQIWTIDEGAALNAGRQGFTRWLYQEFLPVLWVHYKVANCYWKCPGPGAGILYSRAETGDYSDYTEFEGLVPKQTPCGRTTCWWSSLQQWGWTDTINYLTTPPDPSCVYNPPSTQWDYGRCTMGVSINELLTSPAWPFKYYECNVWSPACLRDQPYSSTAGSARGLGTNRGKVNLSLVTPLTRDLDLRRGSVQLGRLMHEGGGAKELVNRRSGRDLTPRTVRLKRSKKRHSARFTTPRGVKPRVRGTLTVHVRKVRVRRGRSRKTRIRRVRTLEVRLRVDRARLQRIKACGGRRGRKTTHIGAHLIVRDRRGRRAQVIGSAVWPCGKNSTSTLRYRVARSVARVSRARAQVRRGRTAAIPLRCDSPGKHKGRLRCPGAVALRARLGGRTVVIGHNRFSLRPGRRANVRVRLTARGRKALAANGGRLAVRAKVSTRHPSGLAFNSRRRIVLVAR